MAIKAYIGLMGAGMSHQGLYNNTKNSIRGYMENREKIANLLQLRNELSVQAMNINIMLNKSSNAGMIVNRYLALLSGINKEIDRLKEVEGLVANWNKPKGERWGWGTEYD